MEQLTRDKIVQEWFFSGLEDIYFAFQIEDSPFRYQPLMNAMGFEKICKSYLLAQNSFEYENLSDALAKQKVDYLARRWSHNLRTMADKIAASIGVEIKTIMDKGFDGFTGEQLIETMEAAYLECRYPVQRHLHEDFPMEGQPNKYHDLIASSGVEKFCFAFTRMVINELRKNFGIGIPKDRFDRMIHADVVIDGNVGARFCNLFLEGTLPGFLE